LNFEPDFRSGSGKFRFELWFRTEPRQHYSQSVSKYVPKPRRVSITQHDLRRYTSIFLRRQWGKPCELTRARTLKSSQSGHDRDNERKATCQKLGGEDGGGDGGGMRTRGVGLFKPSRARCEACKTSRNIARTVIERSNCQASRPYLHVLPFDSTWFVGLRFFRWESSRFETLLSTFQWAATTVPNLVVVYCHVRAYSALHNKPESMRAEFLFVPICSVPK
jgi:hypothetical protein